MPIKVRVPFLVRDRHYLRMQEKPSSGDEILIARPTDFFTIEGESEFSDGPVAPRVAVLDFDPERGRLRPGARFVPNGLGKRLSTYDVGKQALDPDAKLRDLETDAFIQVSTFATVMRTLHFFEQPEILGRKIPWAFDSPQLLVVPRAGQMANAFYERESGSLQFFYYKGSAGHTIYTALSHDIVVHEAAHAVLDGIAPHLYHATTPQSLGLHEAIADLTAIMLNLLNELVVYSLHEISSSQLDVGSVLSQIAAEFGSDIRREVNADYLRAANNDRSISPSDTPAGGSGHENAATAKKPLGRQIDSAPVDQTNPHSLSEVMSGAVYQVFLRSAESLENKYDKNWERRRGSFLTANEKRIKIAAGRLARFVFRALDYLAPGEASFADFGRAVLAASQAEKSATHRERRWLIDELVRRGVVANEKELEVETHPTAMELKDANLEELLTSDQAASEFARQHRRFLRIPEAVEFQVEPRHVATVPGRRRDQPPAPKHLVFRVTWNIEEEYNLGPRFKRMWRFPVGTTLVIDWTSRRAKSLLTTDQGERQRAGRDLMLKRWANEGLLVPEHDGIGPDGRPVLDAIMARQVADDAMQVTGGARVLHILDDPP